MELVQNTSESYEHLLLNRSVDIKEKYERGTYIVIWVIKGEKEKEYGKRMITINFKKYCR